MIRIGEEKKKSLCVLLIVAMVLCNIGNFAFAKATDSEVEKETVSSVSEMVVEEGDEEEPLEDDMSDVEEPEEDPTDASPSDIEEEKEEEEEEEEEVKAAPMLLGSFLKSKASPSSITKASVPEIASKSEFTAELSVPMLKAAPAGMVAAIGADYFPTLQDAINAVDNGETIQVISNVEEVDEITDKPITIDNGKTFTINFKEGSTNHIFYYLANDTTPSAGGNKFVFNISNGSNVTINDMDYRTSTSSVANINPFLIFNVKEASTSLIVNRFTNNNQARTLNNDSFVYCVRANATINDSYFRTDSSGINVQNVFGIDEFGTININGKTECYNNSSDIYANIVMVESSIDKSKTNININGGKYLATYLVLLLGNATVNVNNIDYTCHSEAGLTTFGTNAVVGASSAEESEIKLTNVTSNVSTTTVGDSAIITSDARFTNKVVINGGNYIYNDGELSMDYATMATTSDLIIYNGKFGPIGGVSDANRKEIEDLLAPKIKIAEITNPADIAKGYYYEVPTYTPTPTPSPRKTSYRPSGGSSGGGGSGRYTSVVSYEIDPLKIDAHIHTEIKKENNPQSYNTLFYYDVADDLWYLIKDLYTYPRFAVNEFCNFNNGTYYFDEYGMMAQGWVLDSVGNYYLFEWKKGLTYGQMIKGWKKVNNAWYYFDQNGKMLVNTITPDGYKVGENGAWIDIKQ